MTSTPRIILITSISLLFTSSPNISQRDRHPIKRTRHLLSFLPHSLPSKALFTTSRSLNFEFASTGILGLRALGLLMLFLLLDHGAATAAATYRSLLILRISTTMQARPAFLIGIALSNLLASSLVRAVSSLHRDGCAGALVTLVEYGLLAAALQLIELATSSFYLF